MRFNNRSVGKGVNKIPELFSVDYRRLLKVCLHSEYALSTLESVDLIFLINTFVFAAPP